MKQFSDNSGQLWDVVIDVRAIKTVKDTLAVNLVDLYASEAQRVFSDPCLLVDVLYVLCRDQANGRNVSDVKFGEGMVGDALESGANALLEAVADFFPSSRQRVMAAMRDKSTQISQEMVGRALGAIEKLSLTDLLSATSSPAS